MKQGIVVCTWSGGKDWLDLCLNSLSSLYKLFPIYVVINDVKNADPEWVNNLSKFYYVAGIEGDYREMGAIKFVVKHTDLDEFWLIQDTIEITNPAFIWDSFINYPGTLVTYCKNPMQYYLGKWQTSILKKMEHIPLPKTKEEAIKLEHEFYNAYRDTGNKYNLLGIGICYDEKLDHRNKEANYFEYIFGELRLCVVGIAVIKRLSLSPENLVIEPNRRPFTQEEYFNWLGSFEG